MFFIYEELYDRVLYDRIVYDKVVYDKVVYDRVIVKSDLFFLFFIVVMRNLSHSVLHLTINIYYYSHRYQ